MTIWVDADACPRVIRDILYRAANRAQVEIVFVANTIFPTPASPYIRKIQVEQGFDVADNKIVSLIKAGDLVITADIPLANDSILKGATALNPRGTLYTPNNISERLAIRNVMDELRSIHAISTGPPPLNAKDKIAFSNQLDTWLARNKKKP